MLVITSSADMAWALASPLDVHLKRLLALRRDQLDLSASARFIVTEPDDTTATVAEALGFDPTSNLVDGTPHDDPDFMPSWEWAARHPGWTELVFLLTDDGYAHVLLIPDRDDVDPILRALVREHA